MKLLAACIGIFALCFLSACDWEAIGGTQSFEYDLRGTWVSNDPAIYSGSLKIEYDRITITGYNEGQTPPRGDDSRRPFRGFTKGFALKGYSEEGKIFIEDGGMVQAGIPYTYWEALSPTDYSRVKFLRFTFGDRVETLQSQ